VAVGDGSYAPCLAVDGGWPVLQASSSR
jgi:hypothetical protein